MMKHLTRPLEVKSVSDDGTFEGYGSVFNNIDSYRDVIHKGAFSRTIGDHAQKSTAPSLLWQHDASSPIGVWEKMEEDDHGLKMTGRLALKTQKGMEAYELLKMNAVRGLSIGFSVPTGGEEWDKEKSINNINEIDLWETSIVTFPANREAQVFGVKAAIERGDLPDIREFEQFLTRDAGFTRSQARIILNDGYKSLVTQDAELVKEAEKLLSIF